MIGFLAKALSDSKTGTASTKRIVLFLAGLALAIATIILALAAYHGRDVVGELWAVASTLSVVATGSYVGGKALEIVRDPPAIDPDTGMPRPRNIPPMPPVAPPKED